MDPAPQRGPGGRARPDPTSPFWAVTSYFNPLGWDSRRRNYRVFRRELEVPLLTVELACDGRADLSAEDADVYLRLVDGDFMFQKERLLNVGIRALPPHVTHVAWIDCDVVFARHGWWRDAASALERHAVVQLFDRLCHLPPDGDQVLARLGAEAAARCSILEESGAGSLARRAASFAGASLRLPVRHRAAAGERPVAKGVAWAARRDLLAKIGLYDRAVVGGADSAMVAAFVGDSKGFSAHVSAARQRCLGRPYARWAERAEATVAGRVAALSGHALHLWHGELADRAYEARYELLDRHAFDVERDLRRTAGGAWAWGGNQRELRRAVLDYLASRCEDGRATGPGGVLATSRDDGAMATASDL